MINASNSSRLNPIPGTREERGGDVVRPSAAESDARREAPESMASISMNVTMGMITQCVNGPCARASMAGKSSYSHYL